MIGFQELFFMDNINPGLVVSIFALVVVYLISRKVFPPAPIALAPVFILSPDKMYVWLSSIGWLGIYVTLPLDPRPNVKR